MLDIDFDKFQEECQRLEEMIGKDYSEVAEYVIEKYSSTHYIPGIEYWLHISNSNRDMHRFMQKEIFAGMILFFGSIIRSEEGIAAIPSFNYSPTLGAYEGASYLGNKWSHSNQILLLKR